MTDNAPSPGSVEAIRQGCMCPILDNHYGEGRPGIDGPIFWYNDNCPIHGGRKNA